MAGPVEPAERTPYDATYQRPGDECSSTLEGRHVNVYEDLITHPAHADGFVNKGDPVLVGYSLVGVALKSASSVDDVIPIETEGVWYLNVYAEQANIGVGDMIFIDWTTAVLSNDWTDAPFGHALGQVLSDQTTLIAVKVHAFQLLFPWWLFP